MKYTHKNITEGTFSVKDSKGVCYALGPGAELILDKDNSFEGRIVVEKIKEEKKDNKPRRIDI